MITRENCKKSSFRKAFCLLSIPTIIEPPEINSILRLTHSISNHLGENKNGQIKKLSDLPDLVDLTDRVSNSLKELYAVSQQVMHHNVFVDWVRKHSVRLVAAEYSIRDFKII